MTLTESKLAAATALAAAFSLAATPACAVELPRASDQVQTWDPDALNVEGRGRHGGHHGGWDDDDWDIDGDDVLAGVLILGGIAAISAIAGGNRNRQERYPEPEPFPEDIDYVPPARTDTYGAGGMAEAVDVCVAEVEAGRGPVGSVDRASRSGEGWYVAGELGEGTPFSCWIDGSGRVTDIEAGDYRANFETPVEETAVETTSIAFVSKQQADDALDADDTLEVAQVAELAN
jgi:hypothetical protein